MRGAAPSCRVLSLSLRDWISTGDLGPFIIGATKADLLRAVGEPDQTGSPRRGEDLVSKYGDIDLLFDSSARPFSVSCIEMHAFEGAPSGGSRVHLDPWIVRSGLPLAQMCEALRELGLPCREEVPARADATLNLVVRDDPRLHLDFVTSDRDGWPVGLHGLWMTARR